MANQTNDPWGDNRKEAYSHQERYGDRQQRSKAASGTGTFGKLLRWLLLLGALAYAYEQFFKKPPWE